MKRECPNCSARNDKISVHGQFVRKSDKRVLTRFRCRVCKKTFSTATFQKNYRQKKRWLHPRIIEKICSCESQRRIAKTLKISRTTVARKLKLLALHARGKNEKYINTRAKVVEMEFDDLETFEHSKCKPLSVTLSVEKHTRKILGFRVSSMPAKGLLAKISRKRYGYRKDERSKNRKDLFKYLKKIVHPMADIYSDQSPHYPDTVKRWFPKAQHITTKGRRGCVVGQGELKAGGFDPIFSLNHTFACLRDNLKRLSRRTWCTTKDPKCLEDQIHIYMAYHNFVLTK
ncbi:MAG: transposase [Bdellovibrionales bacterium]|nr:transposase [Bdellovibrionales bacterium]